MTTDEPHDDPSPSELIDARIDEIDAAAFRSSSVRPPR